MKIQIISYGNKLNNKFKDYEVVYSTINSPQSFDEFDINIISLQENMIWETNNYEITPMINSIADLKSLQGIIENSHSSKTILMFPLNCRFKYYYLNYEKRYQYSQEIKNVLSVAIKIIGTIIPNSIIKPWSIRYENTTTIINDTEYKASFYFDTNCPILTSSKGSNKATTIRYSDNLYFSTLDISSNTFNLREFLSAIKIEQTRAQMPQWLMDYRCLDDEEQLSIVSENQQIILEANNKIDSATEKLNDNLKFKSILITNGDELVSVVFKILEKILDCDLSEFEDEKREDFLIKKDGVTYIGEIKGITSNVRSEHVSQLDVHCQMYMDKLQESSITENVKPLLIINPFRTKPISERDDIHENQIKLAIRNGGLIITTETLLKIYEMILNDETTTERVLEVLSSQTGIANINSFK